MASKLVQRLQIVGNMIDGFRPIPTPNPEDTRDLEIEYKPPQVYSVGPMYQTLSPAQQHGLQERGIYSSGLICSICHEVQEGAVRETLQQLPTGSWVHTRCLAERVS